MYHTLPFLPCKSKTHNRTYDQKDTKKIPWKQIIHVCPTKQATYTHHTHIPQIPDVKIQDKCCCSCPRQEVLLTMWQSSQFLASPHVDSPNTSMFSILSLLLCKPNPGVKVTSYKSISMFHQSEWNISNCSDTFRSWRHQLDTEVMAGLLCATANNVLIGIKRKYEF